MKKAKSIRTAIAAMFASTGVSGKLELKWERTPRSRSFTKKGPGRSSRPNKSFKYPTTYVKHYYAGHQKRDQS
jgi:hypothetical protein